jgi:hypothetical protein
MSYNPVEQRDPIYYQDPRTHHQNQGNYELRSTAPSFISYKSGFVDHGTSVQETASDYQHLLQGPLVQEANGSKWDAGFWKRLPVFPILSLLGVLASTQDLDPNISKRI